MSWKKFVHKQRHHREVHKHQHLAALARREEKVAALARQAKAETNSWKSDIFCVVSKDESSGSICGH